MCTLCIHRDILPLPEQTQIYLCTLLVDPYNFCALLWSQEKPSATGPGFKPLPHLIKAVRI